MTARKEALRALAFVLRDKRMLTHFRPDPAIPPADRARGLRLAQTVLRHLGPADAILKPHLERKPPFVARQVLRLATVEMLATGADAFGVVDSAVALMKAQRNTARMAGFVNAVLRRLAETGPEAWAALPPQRLPGWLGGEIRKRFGVDALRGIERAHAAGAPTDLTLKAGGTVPGATVLPTGSLRLPGSPQISDLPGYAEGAWWVQDAAAALPVRLLGDVAGMSVLDLCAAPGGKTLQLAAGGADVTALDLSEARMARVAENLARTGLSARMVTQDALEHEGQYDAVLLDAPCSATGTIRRHPDLPFLKSPTEVEALTLLQMRLLDHALTLLRPGGSLVYCTCSLLPVEGEFQIRAALGRHTGMTVLSADPEALGGEATWASPEGGLRLRPDHWRDLGGLDGFYMARLRAP